MPYGYQAICGCSEAEKNGLYRFQSNPNDFGHKYALLMEIHLAEYGKSIGNWTVDHTSDQRIGITHRNKWYICAHDPKENRGKK